MKTGSLSDLTRSDGAMIQTMTMKPVDILATKPDYNKWMAEPPTVGDWAKVFYREYVGLADEELKQHLMEIRELAWKVYQYRCVASFFFVNYNLGETFGQEWYGRILERVQGGDKFLDLACAFGHVARNLVYDGASQENIISSDLRPEFWELGYQLFRDRERFHCEFRQTDIFDPFCLEEYNGKINILHTSAFFHLFDLERQKKVVNAVLRLVSTKPGTIIFGRQVGNTVPEFRKHPWRSTDYGLYSHNEESFRSMFAEVAGEGWDIKTLFVTRPENLASNGGLYGRLRFTITRL